MFLTLTWLSKRLICAIKFYFFSGETGGYCTCTNLASRARTKESEKKIFVPDEKRKKSEITTRTGQEKAENSVTGAQLNEESDTREKNTSSEEKEDEKNENATENELSGQDLPVDFSEPGKDVQIFDLNKILQPDRMKNTLTGSKKFKELGNETKLTKIVVKDNDIKNKALELNATAAKDKEKPKKTKNSEKIEENTDFDVEKIKLSEERKANTREEEIPERKRIPGEAEEITKPEQYLESVSFRQEGESKNIKENNKGKTKDDGEGAATQDNTAEIEQLKKLLEAKVVEVLSKEEKAASKSDGKMKSKIKRKKKKSEFDIKFPEK
ncbi:unnamed protein product [Gongylonema pulchrum]|uniref:Uncharacterized protein n=1 Tax=Gongylonema pulchrum TaxID=637853 RepID=A0A183DBI1_9BILA|nr:unnamed protein product [Gongylonema pulchrum]